MFEKTSVNKFDKKNILVRKFMHQKKPENFETSCGLQLEPSLGKKFLIMQVSSFFAADPSLSSALIFFSSAVRSRLFLSLILSFYVASFIIVICHKKTSKKSNICSLAQFAKAREQCYTVFL